MWRFLFVGFPKLLKLQPYTSQRWNSDFSDHFSKAFSERGQAGTEIGRGKDEVCSRGERRNRLWKHRGAFGCGNLQGPESPGTSLEAEPSGIMGGCVLAWHCSLSGTDCTGNNPSNICICIHDIGYSKCPIKHLSMEEMLVSSADLVSAWPFWRGSSFSRYCCMLFLCGPDLVLRVQRKFFLKATEAVPSGGPGNWVRQLKKSVQAVSAFQTPKKPTEHFSFFWTVLNS